MKVNIEEVAPCRKKLSVELSAEEVDKAFGDSFTEVVRYAQLPGFRKGHVPKKILERKFGESIKEEVRNRLFQKGFYEGLKEEELSPLGDPDIKIEDINPEKGKELSFTTEVDVRPKFELADYKGIKLTQVTEKVSDGVINERLDLLKARFADYTDKEGAAEKGNLVEGNVTLTIDGEEIFKDQERALRIEGTTLLGIEVGDLEKHLNGTVKGDNKEIKFVTPDSYPREELRGKDAVAVIDVTKVLEEKMPELDDEFAKRLGMESVEALSGQIKESIEMERKNAARQKTEEELIDALVEANKFDLPEGLVSRQAEANFQQSQMQMMMGGNQPDESAQKDLKEKCEKDADRQIRRMIIFDSIGDKEEIKITDSDFNMHISRLSQAYQTTPEKLLRNIKQQDGMLSVQHEIKDIKITQFLMENAEIKI
ncbi:MAG: trigger factor [Planctomycetota bacterium]|jgi:trigger factor